MKTAYLRAQLQHAAGRPGVIDRFTTTMPSDSRIENYPYFTPTPGVIEYNGRREFPTVDQSKYSLTNKEFYSAFSVANRDIEDDKVGGYETKPAEIVLKAGQPFRARNVLTTMANGASTLCHDGTNFFATSHNIGGANAAPTGYSGGGNALTYTATATADALTHTFVVVAHTPEMVVKPFIYQDRKKMRFMTDAGTPQSSLAKETKYWVDLEAAFGVGFWWDACRMVITNTPSLTELFAAFDVVRQAFRGFQLPRLGATYPIEYAHAYTEFNPDNFTVVCSVGLERLFKKLLGEEQIGVSVAGSTAGFTNNTYYKNAGLLMNPYFG